MNSNRFTKQNLIAGLDAIPIKSEKKRQQAITRFETEVNEQGTSQRNAIDLALQGAVKGLSDPSGKLKKAREAAGITLGRQLLTVGKAATLRAQETTDKIVTNVRTPKRHTKSVQNDVEPNKLMTALLVIIAGFVGLMLAVFWFMPWWEGANPTASEGRAVLSITLLIVGWTLLPAMITFLLRRNRLKQPRTTPSTQTT